jgi:hypothetical protein
MTADTAFFAPKARTRLIISFLDHLETLPIDFVDKTLVTAKLFLQGLRQSTIEYKNKISNEIVCSHYGIASDVPKSSQLILIGMRYVKDILCKIACKLVFRSL